TASQRSGATLWETRGGTQLAKLKLASSYTMTAIFSPDGQSVATDQGFGNTIKIWNTQDGKLIKTLDNYTWPDQMAFSPDGTRLLVTSWENASSLWDVSKGIEVARLRGHRSDNVGGAFSHDGHLAATASLEGAARLWDSATGRLQKVLGEEIAGLGSVNRNQELNCAFSSDDRYLATASLRGKVSVWSVNSGSPVEVLEGNG